MKEQCRAKIQVYKRVVECNGFIKNGVCTKCKRVDVEKERRTRWFILIGLNNLI